MMCSVEKLGACWVFCCHQQIQQTNCEVLLCSRWSMEEQIPRFVHGSGSEGSVETNVTNISVGAVEGRESDIVMAMKMVEGVEEDAKVVAGRLATLFSSLQSALSEVTGSSLEHMRCYSESAALLQNASVDAATKGNRFINTCLRLNEEMKTVESLAAQL